MRWGFRFLVKTRIFVAKLPHKALRAGRVPIATAYAETLFNTRTADAGGHLFKTAQLCNNFL